MRLILNFKFGETEFKKNALFFIESCFKSINLITNIVMYKLKFDILFDFYLY